jgi:hypothetical protein
MPNFITSVAFKCLRKFAIEPAKGILYESFSKKTSMRKYRENLNPRTV